jgi:hypothetical protein
VTGPHDSTLPPGRLRRGQFLLNGKIDPQEAHPLELAYAARHILTHRDHDADAFHRSAEDRALAELHATLGNLPRLTFGSAALRAVVVARSGECARCRANLIARVRKLAPPGWDAATVYLIGNGCARCRPRTGPGSRHPAPRSRLGSARPSSAPVTASRPSLSALAAAVPPGSSARVWSKLLAVAFRDDPYMRPLPRIAAEPVHPSLQ